jgi:hypothetical protein
MAGCEAFEIAVEKRLHRALGEPGGALLEEHLAGCERCRTYQAAVRDSEAGMRVEASAAAADVDWERVEREIGGRFRAWPGWLAGALLAGAWMALFAWLSAPPATRPDRMLRSLPAIAIVVALVGLVAGYYSLQKEKMVRLYSIPVIEDSKGLVFRTKTSLAAILNLDLYFGPLEIQGPKGK